MFRALGTDTIAENFGVAISSLRASPLRSALTILGVVIGVATVVTMATIVRGVQNNIMYQLEIAGPNTFYVLKVWSSTPMNPDALPRYVRIRPDLTTAEARRIASLPEISYAAVWGQILGRLEYGGSRTPQVAIFGADDRFTEIQGGELTAGRWFTRQELVGGRAVVVVNANRARQLFGNINPLGRTIQVAGRPAEVVGLYQPPSNIFTPPGSEVGAIVPFIMADRQFRIDKSQALWIPVKPRDGVRMSDAQGAVTVALREMRGLRPVDRNSFDLVAQDQILDTFNQLTGAFFLVMIVLASVALLVGGIGVMAVMMVSVTDRTQEIGLRRAMGATRRDILVQFLVEAGTLTGIGGVLGMIVGIIAASGVSLLLGLTPEIPAAISAIAVVVSIAIGIIFGVIPARRASRLIPVDALRYE
jgi:putative ABC transport system permease protein